VDAVYCVYDPGGAQVLAAAARHGLRVPADLLLVCASEDPSYADHDPPVTTVTFQPEVLAETAVAALTELVAEAVPPAPELPGQRTVPAGLQVRASSRR
jgi:DNA-binding LacI/PurR family transcriptional regulator